MTAPLTAQRGVRVLRRLLGEQNFDLRRLDVPSFRAWLKREVAYWQGDPVFAQRVRIRELRRAHPELLALETDFRDAATVDAATPQGVRLAAIEKEQYDTERAIAGLTSALANASPDRQESLQQKRDTFQARRQALIEEQDALTQSSVARQTLLRLRSELCQLQSTLGLDREEAHLSMLQNQQGRQSDRSGASFEQEALVLTQRHILPDLARSEALNCLRLLSGVTLGAAPTELDQLVIRPARRAGDPVDVLAVIEVKRNINDLAHGFRQRQENLAWLTGNVAGYNPDRYRTRHFTSGHFDRDAVHEQGEATYRITRNSFRRFQRESITGHILGRLYFITRRGPIWGVAGAAFSRIRHRIATDERWDPASDVYLSRLLEWCLGLAEPIETPEVLGLYAARPRHARQVLVVDRKDRQ